MSTYDIAFIEYTVDVYYIMILCTHVSAEDDVYVTAGFDAERPVLVVVAIHPELIVRQRRARVEDGDGPGVLAVLPVVVLDLAVSIVRDERDTVHRIVPNIRVREDRILIGRIAVTQLPLIV